MASPSTPLAAPADVATGGAFDKTWRRMRRTWLRHVLVVGVLCLCIALLLTALEGRGFGGKLIYSLSIGTSCTVIVDGVRLVLAWLSDRARRARGLPPLDTLSGWAGAIPGAIVAIVFGPALGLTIGDFITGGRSQSLMTLGADTRITLAFTALGTFVSVALIGTLEYLSSAREQAQVAQRQAAENQLRLLQSQLEPHMLFNTLANLRVLIGLDAAQAQVMLDRLIAFLRATLNASRTEAHALATEFERIGDYLALMAVRMGPRLRVALELPAELSGTPVPPLLLQPLVENAIKHGLEPQVQGGRIHVRAHAEGGRLLLTVRDTGLGLAHAAAGSTAGTQFGLEQIRQRLATLHGERATLTLVPADDGDGGTLATITLPLPNGTPA